MSGPSHRKKQVVLLRDNYTCQYCGQRPRPHRITVDHVIPLAAGGTNAYANLVACCRGCNYRKSDTRLDPEKERRLLDRIPRWPVLDSWEGIA